MGIGIHKNNTCKECAHKDNNCICYKCSNKQEYPLMGDMYLCGCSNSPGDHHIGETFNVTVSGSVGRCDNYIEDWIKVIKYG